MGRKSKYQTDEERKEARRKYQRDYYRRKMMEAKWWGRLILTVRKVVSAIANYIKKWGYL